jgi:CRP-like cAMP-binding protein
MTSSGVHATWAADMTRIEASRAWKGLRKPGVLIVQKARAVWV